MLNNNLPRILISAPQSDVKNYCFEEWLDNIKKFDYPSDNITLYLVDNSDTPDNCKALNKRGITCKWMPKEGRGMIEVLALCHQECADYALKNKYDYLFHLETDVFPPPNALLDLISCYKPVVSGMYHIYHGAYRQLAFKVQPEREVNGYMKSFALHNSIGEYMNDKMLQVFSGSLGCTLIHNSVLQRVKFRSVVGQDHHADTWFSVDLKANNIPFFINTEILCEHKNQSWGTYGINYF